jgi:hypothetical protein
MNLHRNAALSLKGRRELCRRMVEGERTVSEADAHLLARRDGRAVGPEGSGSTADIRLINS